MSFKLKNKEASKIKTLTQTLPEALRERREETSHSPCFRPAPFTHCFLR